jgi:hypothetical protein
MKKVLLVVFALSLVFCVATVLRAGTLGPGVKDTPHDVGVITGQEGSEPCAMCHTPHFAVKNTAPLWNREQFGGPTTYTMYVNAETFEMEPTGSTPGYPSSLCLVCHNGVYSSLVNYPGPGSHTGEQYNYQMPSTFWAMLNDEEGLSNDHPISFTYNPDDDLQNNGFPGIDDGKIVPDANCLGAPGFNGGFPLYGVSKTTFECATCHSVHDTVSYNSKLLVNGKSSGSQVFFLRCDNTGSQLCGACHVKRLEGGIAHTW